VIETIHQGLKADGILVSINKLCQWLEERWVRESGHPVK